MSPRASHLASPPDHGDRAAHPHVLLSPPEPLSQLSPCDGTVAAPYRSTADTRCSPWTSAGFQTLLNGFVFEQLAERCHGGGVGVAQLSNCFAGEGFASFSLGHSCKSCLLVLTQPQCHCHSLTQVSITVAIGIQNKGLHLVTGWCASCVPFNPCPLHLLTPSLFPSPLPMVHLSEKLAHFSCSIFHFLEFAECILWWYCTCFSARCISRKVISGSRGLVPFRCCAHWWLPTRDPSCLPVLLSVVLVAGDAQCLDPEGAANGWFSSFSLSSSFMRHGTSVRKNFSSSTLLSSNSVGSPYGKSKTKAGFSHFIYQFPR